MWWPWLDYLAESAPPYGAPAECHHIWQTTPMYVWAKSAASHGSVTIGQFMWCNMSCENCHWPYLVYSIINEANIVWQLAAWSTQIVIGTYTSTESPRYYAFGQGLQVEQTARNGFRAAISWDDLTENILRKSCICSRHLVSGRPVDLYDNTNLDLLPTLNLYHGKRETRQKARTEAADRREKTYSWMIW